jgi:hypothetical protein
MNEELKHVAVKLALSGYCVSKNGDSAINVCKESRSATLKEIKAHVRIIVGAGYTKLYDIYEEEGRFTYVVIREKI